MTPSVGLVIVDMTNAKPEEMLQIHDAIQKTPPGRVLGVVYDLPHQWESSYPWESEVSRLVLGNPSERSTHPEWQILATVVARCCAIQREGRSVKGEIGVILFVRQGERAYVRRKSVSKAILESSRLDSLHPVFTRDVSNNVWHLSSTNPVSELKSRLIALLTWSDEVTLVFRGVKITKRAHRPLDLDRSAVGIPTKISYSWSPHW